MRHVTIAYGMTEISPLSTQTSVDDAFDRRVSAVGRVQPHLEVKIVDGNGCVAPASSAPAGISVMRGYWGDPERTADAVDESGWMRKGALSTMDADGYIVGP